MARIRSLRVTAKGRPERGRGAALFIGEALVGRVIAAQMNEEGLPARTRGRWHPQMVHRILQRDRTRQKGYQAKFGKTYTYLDIDGWQYWTMGAPLRKTILINRARVRERGRR